MVMLFAAILLAMLGIVWPLCGLTVLYGGLQIIMAGLSVIKHKNPAYFCVAFICLSVHLAYGLGTLKGLMVNGERL